MPCSNCGREPVVARGLCSGCYTRLKRNGTIARKNVQNRGRLCREDGCTEPAHAKGYCTLHYMRAQHPLRSTWRSIRSRYPGQTPSEWLSFNVFLSDVGERPSAKHQLRRIEEDQPYSTTNVRWVGPTTVDHMTPDQRRTYSRQWSLNSSYGINIQEFENLLEKQNGRCAICCEKETRINGKSGKPQPLSVDHDHDTGKVRGLLCVRCNRMLGYGRDNPEILRRAIAYLERHKEADAA